MAQSRQTVSVVVPTRNRPKFLRQALASIRAVEGEDLRFEILVGDNGPSEETRALAREFEAVYLTVERRGSAAARNECLSAATSEFVAFLDDDDIWLPGHIRPHLQALADHPEWEAVIGQAISTFPDLTPKGPPWPESDPGTGDDLTRRMLSGFFPQIGTCLVRRRVRNLVGPLDETLIGGQDLDWMLRIARRHKLGYIPAPSLLVRSRPEGTYDALQCMRVGYDRKVFLRHAVPEWRIWRSPLAFLRGYTGTLMHFYRYFEDSARTQSLNGNRSATYSAVRSAFHVFPFRAGYHLTRKRPLRDAIVRATFKKRTGTSALSGDNLSAKNDQPNGALPAKLDEVTIALAFDSHFAAHAVAVIASLAHTAPGARFHFLLLYSGITEEVRSRLEESATGARFTWLEVNERTWPSGAAHGFHRQAAMFRLALEQLAPDRCSRVIYLDTDVIVMRDIRHLWTVNLASCPIGAIQDAFIDAQAFAERFGLLPGSRYFNSGVLVIDLEKVRADKSFSKATDFVAQHNGSLEFADQDGLNWIFWGRWQHLDVSWNVQRHLTIQSLEETLPPEKRLGVRLPGIVHYTGPEKPWVASAYHPWAWLYWSNLARTPFYHEIARKYGITSFMRLRLWARWVRRQPKHKSLITVTPGVQDQATSQTSDRA